MAQQNSADLLRIARALQFQQEELELVILKEPTGDIRNVMTEINIELLCLLDKLKSIS